MQKKVHFVKNKYFFQQQQKTAFIYDDNDNVTLFLPFFIVGLLLPSVYGTSPAQEDKMTKCTGPAQGRGFNNQFQFMKNNSVKAAVFQGCVRQFLVGGGVIKGILSLLESINRNGCQIVCNFSCLVRDQWTSPFFSIGWDQLHT